MMQRDPIWRLDRISKQFSGSKVLDQVSVDIHSGEVHALCGENGAGKTTLMRILAGNLGSSSGRLLHRGKSFVFKSPLQARAAGICMVYQERSLFMNMSIAENIFPGSQPVNALGLIDYQRLYFLTRELLQQLHLDDLTPDMPVSCLSTAQCQMVELAKALAMRPSVLILDEPTASLTVKEVDILVQIIRDLKQQGVALIYISHRLEEIFEVADKVTVLKDGRLVATFPAASTTQDALIRMMVGRDIDLRSGTSGPLGAIALELRSFSGKAFFDISLTVRKGEIVGLSGLTGSGRTEIAEAVFAFGSLRRSGELLISGRPLHLTRPSEAIRAGISYIPEERKTLGGFMDMSVAENILSADPAAACRRGLFSRHDMHSITRNFISMLGIVTSSTGQTMRELSGGNQQKAILAKWLLKNNEILVVNEPTHGVDIGAKFEIYRLLRRLSEEGKAILLISSEMTELLHLSDTIHVLYKGKIRASYSRQQATEEKIANCAAGS